jgi:hypothetical protein
MIRLRSARSPARRSNWVVAAAVVAGLVLAGLGVREPAAEWLEGRRICRQLRAGESPRQYFGFSNPTKEDVLGQLDPGNYQLTVTSDCYVGQCSFEVREVPDVSESTVTLPAGNPCRGQQLTLQVCSWGTEWDYCGFAAPGVLDRRRVHVQIQRDGRAFWEGTPGRDCRDGRFCVVPEPP